MAVTSATAVTHGFPSSRQIVAAWLVLPPTSVTTAPARVIASSQSMLEVLITSTPKGRPTTSLGRFATTAWPTCVPGLAASPVSIFTLMNEKALRLQLYADGNPCPPLTMTFRHLLLKEGSRTQGSGRSRSTKHGHRLPAASCHGTVSLTAIMHMCVGLRQRRAQANTASAWVTGYSEPAPPPCSLVKQGPVIRSRELRT
jgi:hypothetical protein